MVLHVYIRGRNYCHIAWKDHLKGVLHVGRQVLILLVICVQKQTYLRII